MGEGGDLRGGNGSRLVCDRSILSDTIIIYN